VGNLGRIKPLTRQQPELPSGYFADILDRERTASVEIAEHFYYGSHLVLSGYLEMFLDHLCESHLSNPYHASPASIADVSALDVVVELGEASAIGEPRGGHKQLVK